MRTLNESYIKISLTLLSTVFFLSFFQNCSEVSFQELKTSASVGGLGDPSNPNTDPTDPTNPPIDPTDPPVEPPINLFPESFDFNQTTTVKKVDVLFVVDESVSMDNILKQVNKGFESLTSLSYPENIKFAVTNMAPAKESSGVLSPSLAPYIGDSLNINNYPGYLKLVDAASIKSYGKMSIKGCSEKWFSPLAKNADDEYCLTAATQIANTATYVESGVTTLKQLVQVYDNKEKELFRRGALANIVFVSDTHDAGYNYYGTSNAPNTMISVQNLLTKIHALHGGDLAEIKFSGIVPLPSKSSDHHLNDVNVVGEHGGTISTGEKTNEYSYLKYIKDTGGVAAHVVQPDNDYTPVINELIKSSSQTTIPTFELGQACMGQLKVTLNGVPLSESDYILFNAGKGIKLSVDLNRDNNQLIADCIY